MLWISRHSKEYTIKPYLFNISTNSNSNVSLLISHNYNFCIKSEHLRLKRYYVKIPCRFPGLRKQCLLICFLGVNKMPKNVRCSWSKTPKYLFPLLEMWLTMQLTQYMRGPSFIIFNLRVPFFLLHRDSAISQSYFF